MDAEASLPAIVVLGDETQAGTYLLRIDVSETLHLAFGRFKRGKVITVPAGEVVYVGSALGRKGATSLARRLVRHATRSGSQSSHAIREQMLAHFSVTGLGSGNLLPRNDKALFWNIDHLLDQPSVTLTHVIAMRSELRLEAALSKFMENEFCTSILEKGLGANDAPGCTHLLRVEVDETWWRTLPDRLLHLMTEYSDDVDGKEG